MCKYIYIYIYIYIIYIYVHIYNINMIFWISQCDLSEMLEKLFFGVVHAISNSTDSHLV